MNLACEEGGRSASFVFQTADQKFIIKTITKQERKLFLKKILLNYSQRIFSSETSKLARIFGAFELSGLKQNFIIMENILHQKESSFIFDLKGSKVDRKVKGIQDPKNPPTGVVLKDVNFSLLNYNLKLTTEMNNEIAEVLIEDFEVLRKMGIMDYSVLLGICIECEKKVNLNRYSYINDDGFIVSVGIIDFFQEYNLSKVGEKTVKSVFNKSEDISSTNPDDYFTRIALMVLEMFK